MSRAGILLALSATLLVHSVSRADDDAIATGLSPNASSATQSSERNGRWPSRNVVPKTAAIGLRDLALSMGSSDVCFGGNASVDLSKIISSFEYGKTTSNPCKGGASKVYKVDLPNGIVESTDEPCDAHFLVIDDNGSVRAYNYVADSEGDHGNQTCDHDQATLDDKGRTLQIPWGGALNQRIQLGGVLGVRSVSYISVWNHGVISGKTCVFGFTGS